MKTPADTAETGRGALTADLNRGGPPPAGSPVVVLSPLVMALERWVNEGGSGTDPDRAARSHPAQITPRHKDS